MIKLKIGVVDVFLLRGAANDLRVLVLRRAEGTRCTGAWEAVHGNIKPRERPEAAALREVREETGLEVARLYSVICQPFYLHQRDAVQVAVVFAAFAETPDALALGPEHDTAEWLRPEEALRRLSWPRSVSALRDALQLLRAGHAGPVEDVLRVF
ncbi:MAG TPA: NUDIX domain-containing protein [Gemmatimonadaceae bacterium]|nr:NUDIX domain-containing protein [Gemmatimonadaceae bacterium]